MEVDILELCKRVVENKGEIDGYGSMCSGIDCCVDRCPFNNIQGGCSSLPKECLKIAQQYIDEHEPKTERNDNVEKSFREVIRDIKEDEVWECRNFIIYLDDLNNVNIDSKNGGFIESAGIVFDGILTLQRKKYDFIEAFKAYEEGKEIESCESGDKYKMIGEKDTFYYDKGGSWDKGSYLTLQEIRGKWHINK